jgi:hypothetical protein
MANYVINFSFCIFRQLSFWVFIGFHRKKKSILIWAILIRKKKRFFALRFVFCKFVRHNHPRIAKKQSTQKNMFTNAQFFAVTRVVDFLLTQDTKLPPLTNAFLVRVVETIEKMSFLLPTETAKLLSQKVIGWNEARASHGRNINKLIGDFE